MIYMKFSPPVALQEHLKRTHRPFPLQQVLGSPGVYVIMVEDDDWRPERFRPIYFGEAWDTYSSVGPFHENFLEWCAAAQGIKLFVSFMLRFDWSEEQRQEAATELPRQYAHAAAPPRRAQPSLTVFSALTTAERWA